MTDPGTSRSQSLDMARRADAEDPLSSFRARFHIPCREDGTNTVYLCGNSLGLQPTHAAAVLEEEMEDWATLGVRGHEEARNPWFNAHEPLAPPGERLVGAHPGEVIWMNSLTVNLHLLMVSFFRPVGDRTRILVESPAFPSDLCAARTHLQSHGLDPDEHLLITAPRAGEDTIRNEDIVSTIERHGESLALALIGGVNYITGQVLDMPAITRAAHAAGALIALDLAHAVGNIPLSLHDWDVDCAAWCSYKYLNAGPGGPGGCFIHERHTCNIDLPRFGGWWGMDPGTRFAMQDLDDCIPVAGADGWQLSNPSIMAFAPLRAALEIFDEVGMIALREKSLCLNEFMLGQLDHETIPGVEIITPRAPDARGCQLSLRISPDAQACFAALRKRGIICDLREPDVIRVTPCPLYSTFDDVLQFTTALACVQGGTG